jgi:hypothetical protein
LEPVAAGEVGRPVAAGEVGRPVAVGTDGESVASRWGGDDGVNCSGSAGVAVAEAPSIGLMGSAWATDDAIGAEARGAGSSPSTSRAAGAVADWFTGVAVVVGGVVET